MFISVVIPSFMTSDRFSGIDRLLLVLYGFENQTVRKSDFEVVIVDDGSEYSIAEALEDFKFSFNLRILRKEHSGMCSSFNYGVSQAIGEIIFISVDDSIPNRFLIQDIIKNHSYSNHKEVFHYKENVIKHAPIFSNMITAEIEPLADPVLLEKCKLLELDKQGITPDDVMNKFSKLEDLCCKDVFNGNANMMKVGKPEEQWLAVRMGNTSILKTYLVELGGLDEAFDPTGWYSDLELGYKIKLSNGINRFSDSALYYLPHIKGNIGHEEPVCYKYFCEKYPVPEVVLVRHFFDMKCDYEEYFRYVNQAVSENIDLSSYISGLCGGKYE